MLKGTTLTILFIYTVMCPFFASESVRAGYYIYLQDSTKVTINEPSQPKIEFKQFTNVSKDTAASKSYGQARPDSISSRSAQRNQEVSSQKIIAPSKQEIVLHIEDTSSIRIYINIHAYQQNRTDEDDIYFDNFLLAIPEKKMLEPFDSSLISKYSVVKISPIVKDIAVQEEKQGFEGVKKAGATMNWLPGILLLSLFTFSWIKMMYQKYVTQVVISLVNYQVALRLLRERNVLFRNMAFGLNIVFAINAGLFIFFLFQYFGISQLHPNNIISVLVYSSGVIIIYNIKTFFCRVLGYIFKVQDEFSEYIHNINLFNKNIGLFLFPIIILFPYINVSIKPIVLFVGIMVIVILFFLSAVRGFQIIMRKGISLFYLILYLCAIEILPILIAIKYSSTLI